MFDRFDDLQFLQQLLVGFENISKYGKIAVINWDSRQFPPWSCNIPSEINQKIRKTKNLHGFNVYGQ